MQESTIKGQTLKVKGQGQNLSVVWSKRNISKYVNDDCGFNNLDTTCPIKSPKLLDINITLPTQFPKFVQAGHLRSKENKMFPKTVMVLFFGAVLSLDVTNKTLVCQAPEKIFSYSWSTPYCQHYPLLPGLEENKEIKKASGANNIEVEASTNMKVRLALLGGIFILAIYLYSSTPKLP